jgi:hypothetical protein
LPSVFRRCQDAAGYMATIASNRAAMSGTNTVSAGIGPVTVAPAARAASIAGAITSRSSVANLAAFAGVRVQAAHGESP